MIEIDIPGFGKLALHNLVMDYNGTLALDSRLLPGVKARLEHLAERIELDVITADTFGKAKENLSALPCKLMILPVERQDQAKLSYVEELGANRVVAIGNGRNDHLMLARAALGIAVLQQEGAAYTTLSCADLVAPDIGSALDLLLFPKRLIATLRS